MAKKSKYAHLSREQIEARLEKLEKEGYGLKWEDKPEAVADLCDTQLPVLKEDKSKEIISDPNLPTNYIIEGDNYHSLFTLNFTHKKKIDVIYIDPPYNTGKKNEWKYNDHWVDENDTYRHSKWLSFMNKRLRLAKQLLKDEGVIFISIDDNEVAQLKLLCDKIFGERNFCGQFNWYKSATPPNLSNKIKKNIEFILCYEKRKSNSKYRGIFKPSKSDDPITKTQNSIKQLIFPPKSIQIKLEDRKIKKGIYGTKKYPNKLINDLIVENGTNKNEVIFENRFIWNQDKLEYELLNGTDIKCSKTLVISYKKKEYLEEVPPSLIDDTVGVETTEESGKKLIEMFGKKVFDFPKPVSLMKYILNFNKQWKNESIFLDFFAGSGTTAHAVLELNKEDGGNRKFILCTNNENNICTEVTYPRVKKVIEGYADKEGIPANVKYFTQTFVNQVTSDKDKRELVNRSTELLCMAENTFDVISKRTNKNDFAIFGNNVKITAIIYDESQIDECVNKLNQLNNGLPAIIYVFSYDHTYFAEDFENLKIKFTVKPIPEAILNVYRKINKLKRK